MSEISIRHHTFVELLASNARIETSLLPAVTNARRVEIFADITPLAFSTTQLSEALVGTYLGGIWFEYDAPTTNTSTVAPIRVGSIRNLADKYSGDGQIELGVRTVLTGWDDGVNVYMRQDGIDFDPAVAQADWTAAQAARAVAFATVQYIGHDDALGLYTALRLHEFWLKVNGVLVLHIRPEAEDGAALPDLSEFGHAPTVKAGSGAATEDTTFSIRSSVSEGEFV